jgi:hypothetical protein
MKTLLIIVGLACGAIVLMISYAEKRQEVALEALSNYKPEPQQVLDDDADLKLVTARSPNMRDER